MVKNRSLAAAGIMFLAGAAMSGTVISLILIGVYSSIFLNS